MNTVLTEDQDSDLERSNFQKMFKEVGFVVTEVTQIQNPNESIENSLYQFELKTQFGKILIGWKQQFITIDWTKSNRNITSNFFCSWCKNAFSHHIEKEGRKSVRARSWGVAKLYLFFLKTAFTHNKIIQQ